MAKLSVGFGLFSALVAIIAACGGSALTGGAGAQAGAAGSASGGAGSGGDTSFAGSNAAGASAAGGPAAGGASSDACSATKVAGSCDAYQPSFWHNPKTGLCEPFIYGGCGGNANRYSTREACLKACPGGGSAWGACTADAQCTLTSVGCCAACEPIADQDLLALNSQHLAEQIASRPCASVGACAPCPMASELSATGKYFRGVCVAGQCSALDVRQSRYTECSDSSQCALRSGVNCCPSCLASFVAVNSKANFCADGPEPCPKCASPAPPPSLSAVCVEQRCLLQQRL